jgi:hypothetical protein
MAPMNSSTFEKLLLQLLFRTCITTTPTSRFLGVLPGTNTDFPSNFHFCLHCIQVACPENSVVSSIYTSTMASFPGIIS